MKFNNSLLQYMLECLLLAFLFLALACFWQVRPSYGQEAAITDFTLTNSENDLLLYLTVTDWFSEEMEAAIHNGIPIAFVFNIELLTSRSNWPDKKIIRHEFNHILQYDSLKKEYIVQRHEKGNGKVTDSLEVAKKLMSEINGFKVVPLDDLDQNESYTLRAKAKLARKTMPLYFHYLIPFSSPWDFETEWHNLTLQLVL
ncbi:MAG: DUF4390 domain-containing protein [Desulfobulbales bacterium]|nr:DUF4390 domain-containing protein [Desulfobulbales bacterium]